ncbi:MAG: hypothetical protein LBU13_03755 [Synergistaceae bacterium]|jgi:hypothetical protein|nr:hypothetical protein [Synergistaceae bacterium]
MWKQVVIEAQKLIKLVETLKGKTGPEKKAMVVEAMRAVIDIPCVPEWLEDIIEPALYGLIVDLVHAYWRRKTGNKLEVIPDDDAEAVTAFIEAMVSER